MVLKVDKYNEGGGVWTINAQTDKQMVCELRGPAQTLSKLKVLYLSSHTVKIIPTKNFNYQINAIIRDGGPIAVTVRISNTAETPIHPRLEVTPININDHSTLIDVNTLNHTRKNEETSILSEPITFCVKATSWVLLN